jgi:crotonobetainyl-CoA:carnitine CoA-transferase CaiB-like acyl-CoA transferase
MRQRDGAELWRNTKIMRRALSAPVVLGSAIAIADYQGYVHYLDKNTGVFVARVRTAKQRVSNPLVGANNIVVVLTDGGTLAGFRATPRTSPAAAAPAAAPDAAPPSTETVPPAATPTHPPTQ